MQGGTPQEPGSATLAAMDDVANVQCPYCFEWQELFVDPSTQGSFVEDCSVCCRPWQVSAERDEDGGLRVHLDRAS